MLYDAYGELMQIYPLSIKAAPAIKSLSIIRSEINKMELLHNRRTPLLIALVLGLSLGTVGCNGNGEKTGETETKEGLGKVIATVNGEPITESELLEYRSTRRGTAGAQERQVMLDELITQKVVYQDALSQKLDKDPEVAKELEQLRKRVLLSAAVRKAMKEAQVTDEELRAEYDKLKERMVAPEYKASHILVKEEEQARQLIEQLNQGADFAALAKEHSTDASGKRGGDLGWFSPQQMVPPFSQTVAQLEKGSYTSEPVKTQFGWHVIMLEDQRQSEPPAFEETRDRLEQMLKQRKVRDQFSALKEKANISIMEVAEAPAAEDAGESAAETEESAGEEKADTSSAK
jgi:peptidyl-prolyl cis-trans isomerase C